MFDVRQLTKVRYSDETQCKASPYRITKNCTTFPITYQLESVNAPESKDQKDEQLKKNSKSRDDVTSHRGLKRTPSYAARPWQKNPNKPVFVS